MTSPNATELIRPRTLKGFRDFLPETMIPRERLIAIARDVYRSYGFCPIDTPALEFLEILTGKGGDESDRQLYRFEDHGGRQVGMRFDLTVPLARFVAQHIQELGTPFKRYQFGTVWRGENPQAGRFREFMQCDFDTIGTTSVVADIEMVLVIHDLIRAIGISAFTIRVNNRKVLSGLLEKQGLQAKESEILRALDKLPKMGRERVAREMMEFGGSSPTQSDNILQLVETVGSTDEVLARVDSIVSGNSIGEEGVARLEELFRGARAAGIAENQLHLDVSIARGLDYYTGTVVETFLDHLPKIGSICSGGRYDNLAGLYTKQDLPGVGASLGLDRLLAAMERLQLIESLSTTGTVFVPFFDQGRLDDYLRIASRVRAAGINVEVYPEPKKLGQQLKYASARGFRIALIAGDKELDSGTCQVKDLASRTSEEIPLGENAADLIAAIKRVLSG